MLRQGNKADSTQHLKCSTEMPYEGPQVYAMCLMQLSLCKHFILRRQLHLEIMLRPFIHDVAKSLEPQKISAVSIGHAITGYDTLSYFGEEVGGNKKISEYMESISKSKQVASRTT